ncbi:15866_t:CDS:2, partial [Dentiscutata heterogama]
AQNRQKQLHDRKIQNITEFGIGEKVLVYRASRQYNRSVKLEPKWSGPYYIHQVFDWNVVKLRTMEGQVVSTPISTSLIKKDITSPVPSGVLVTPPPVVALPPFAETHDLIESVDVTRTALLQAIRLKNRIEMLVLAYYLSMLFVTATPTQQGAIRRKVTRHYYLAARHVYNLFAPLGFSKFMAPLWLLLIHLGCY